MKFFARSKRDLSLDPFVKRTWKTKTIHTFRRFAIGKTQTSLNNFDFWYSGDKKRLLDCEPKDIYKDKE